MTSLEGAWRPAVRVAELGGSLFRSGRDWPLLTGVNGPLIAWAGRPLCVRAVLQHVEATFDPLPFDQGAARLYGQICAAVRAAGRQPRKRSSDLQIAATAAGNLLPLYTASPADFQGTEGLVEIVSVKARPDNR